MTLSSKNENVRSIIFDLGYSYTQIKDSKRACHLTHLDLNMKMGLNDFSANEVINKLDAIELEKILNSLEKKKRQKKL